LLTFETAPLFFVYSVYKTLALPTLVQRCETWTVGQQDKYRIVLAEIKFMLITAKCTWQDCKTSVDIYPVVDGRIILGWIFRE
jgi:hypothetical protein